ncbi:MAG: LysR family transcriptional regulator [Polaromonas sp.]|uniref:LysR family transcriptional regulator n=1 Tax=Polaromonas sp. TaxID=1869339 RepID=UPI002489B77C|nr:LysR family transcriptional regulator [Polaromonas sp.]MDI1237424.1 LysR family transcriptional regulator [Polaromonas sp.]
MTTPTIELRLWRQFVAVAEELHFGRAAVRLHMTQPPLTQAIAHLEKLLAVRLFDRTKRSVHMTAAGVALLPQVLDLLARAQALPGQARAAAAGEIGRLRLAFISTAGFSLLPAWVRAFREHEPQVQLELLEATGDMQLQAFERHDIDAGIMLHSPGFAPPGLTHRLIAREALVLALAEQHPLAAKASLGLDEVLTQPLVIFPRRILPSLHDAIFGMYHAAAQPPQVAQEAIQMQTIVNLVSAGLGVAWVPDSVRQFQRPGVVYRTVAGKKGRPVPVCETSLFWPVDAVNPCLERLVAFAPTAPALPA